MTTYRGKTKLADEVREMIELADFDAIELDHVPVLFSVLFQSHFGTWPKDVKAERVASFVEEHFGGDAYRAAKYVRWIFRRAAKEREQRKTPRIYPFNLVFSPSLVTDYVAATGEPEAPAAAEGATTTSGEAAEEGDGRPVLRRGDHVELATHLVAELQAGEVAPVSAYGEIHCYEPERGLWPHADDAAISRRVQGFAGMPVDGKRNGLTIRASDVVGITRLTHARITNDRFFDDAPRGMAFADGFVRLREDGTIERVDHAPENRARFAYPFAFEAKHSRKLFARFMKDAFRDDDDAQQKINLVLEFAGASLFGIATRYQRCIVLEGDGDNAKSTMLDILSAAMPPGSTCAVPPQQWGNEYRRAMMAGKLFNPVSELPEQDIIASESFKAIVTGDAIDARHIREAPFTYRPSAGHAFAANTLPGTQDQSDGFWRRFAVITFTRKFKESEKNAKIGEEIIAAELPGIVQWMIEGAARLVARGAYELPASHEGALSKWRSSADQVSAFLAECTKPAEPGEGTAASKLYEAYAKWATKSGHRALSSTKFGMRLGKLGKGSTHTKRGNFVPVALRTTEFRMLSAQRGARS